MKRDPMDKSGRLYRFVCLASRLVMVDEGGALSHKEQVIIRLLLRSTFNFRASVANSHHTSRSAMEVQRHVGNVLRKLSADEPGAKATRDKGGRPNRGSASGRQLKIPKRLRRSGWPGGMQDFLANKGPIFPARRRRSQ